MVVVADCPRAEDSSHWNDAAREELQRRANPRATKHLPSFLPLHVGMRLLLFSKDCVRLGLMNGCECVLEHIVIDNGELSRCNLG